MLHSRDRLRLKLADQKFKTRLLLLRKHQSTITGVILYCFICISLVLLLLSSDEHGKEEMLNMNLQKMNRRRAHRTGKGPIEREKDPSNGSGGETTVDVDDFSFPNAKRAYVAQRCL